MQHQNLFVFDIETVPDTDAVKSLTGSNETDINLLRNELEDYHLEITEGRNSFLRQPFHKVVAISFLEAEIHRNEGFEHYEIKQLRSGGNENSNEAELVEGFFKYLSKIYPRLVTFNGRTFDLPVLKYRAMANGISAKWLYSSGDKWNNYNSRYSLDWHCDLIDAFSDYGASARIKMNEVCSILGFPGKFGVDGSKVTVLYDNSKIDEIRNYCETDVLNTYLLYLRNQQHKGVITTQSYNQAIGDVLSLIKTEKDDKQHLGEFFEAWEESCGNKFTL